MEIVQSPLTHDILPEKFAQLEATLLYWQHLDAGIWPIKEWQEARLTGYIHRLYLLVHECLAMHLHLNAPVILPYRPDEEDTLSRVQLIQLIRQLIFCCTHEVIGRYRSLSPEEDRLVTTLQQINAALIGGVYLQRPGQERLAATYFR
jgi:hypothetical protein